MLKQIICLWLGLLISISIAFPLGVSAQTEPDLFPGNLVAEGRLIGVDPASDLIYLKDDLVLGREAASGRYRMWRVASASARDGARFSGDPFDDSVLKTIDPGYELAYLGHGQIMAWRPDSGRYKVYRYNDDPQRQAGLLSGQPVIEGNLGKRDGESRFIYVGYDRVLEWEPATGNYRYWRYDPTPDQKPDSFPGRLLAEGNWPTIRSGHELVYLGYRRILDWTPESGHYRIWRYDPMTLDNDNPLSGQPLVEGGWGDARAGHQLISLGDNRLLDWDPATNGYQVRQFSLRAIEAFTLSDIGAGLENQTVSGVTAITHGRQGSDSGGDALLSLAEDIHNNAGGWLINYTVDGNGNGFIESCTNNCQDPAVGEKGYQEAVLLFDWAAGSNEASTGWGESAGDALFNILILTGLLDPTAIDNPPYHFIGHSFGTAVTSEVIEHLAYFDIAVDQVTFLDPHDFDQGFGFDGAQELFTLGKPPGYGVSVWNNVAFAEAYYQTREVSGVVDITPNGRPIPGAYNKLLFAELPNPDDYPPGELSGDHGYVWLCFYRGTVQGSLPAGCPEPLVAVDFTQTGYAFSRVENRLDRPGPNFYTDQDHKFSEPSIVITTTGEPYLPGLISLDLTVDDVIRGGWHPDWIPFEVANGDFENWNDNEIVQPVCAIQNICPQPGWSFHGGGGEAHFDQSANNVYMVLDWGNTTHTHNWLYVPPNTTALHFDLRRQDGPLLSTDILAVQAGTQTVALYALEEDNDNEDTDFVPQQVALPQSLLGQVITLTFKFETEIELENGSTAWIDNVTLFAPQDIQVTTGITKSLDSGGTVDFGVTEVGMPVDQTFTIKNVGALPLTVTEIITVPGGFSLLNNIVTTTLTAGQMTTFTLQLDAIMAGVFSGTVELASNDPDENPFGFLVRGVVETPGSEVYLPVVVRE
jgi:hypothetical protein